MKDLNNVRYSDSDLLEFKMLILTKIVKANEDLELLRKAYRNDADNGTDDTYARFKGYDDSSEAMSKESNVVLAFRQEKLLENLKHALVRIGNKSYGICRITGKIINKERLRLVPHATLSVEAKLMQL